MKLRDQLPKTSLSSITQPTSWQVTTQPSPSPGGSHVPNHVLSIFPGIGLFDRAFEEEGFTTVRGKDLLWGADARDFHTPHGVYEGVIGGPPCQDFSDARRCEPTGNGLTMLREFCRIVEEAGPAWFMLENVRRCPDVTVRGYTMQRFWLNSRDCGCRQRRLRRFQFGSLDGVGLVIPPPVKASEPAAPCCMASEGTRSSRRTWADFCELQGLPRTFKIPGLSRKASYEAVGNGVPIPMGRVLAIAIKSRHVTAHQRVCVCGCGRVPPDAALHHSAACRKRMERARRDSLTSSAAGGVT